MFRTVQKNPYVKEIALIFGTIGVIFIAVELDRLERDYRQKHLDPRPFVNDVIPNGTNSTPDLGIPTNSVGITINIPRIVIDTRNTRRLWVWNGERWIEYDAVD